MPEPNEIADWDAIDVVCLCHAGMAQDAPNPPKFYLNQILNLMFGYLSVEGRKEVEEYLAEKKYLPPLKLVAPNEAQANEAAQIIIND